jgi:hypothetical protein
MAGSIMFSAIDTLLHLPERRARNTSSRSYLDGSDLGSFIDDGYAALGASDFVRGSNDHGQYHGGYPTHANDIRNSHGNQRSFEGISAPRVKVKPISKELFRRLLDENERMPTSTSLPVKTSGGTSNVRTGPNKPAGPRPDQGNPSYRGDAPQQDQNPDNNPYRGSARREIRIRSRDGRMETVGLTSLPLCCSASTSVNKTTQGTQPAAPAAPAARARTRSRSRSTSPQPQQSSSRMVRIRAKNGQESVMAVSYPPPASSRAASSGRREVRQDRSPAIAPNTDVKQGDGSDIVQLEIDRISQLIYDSPKSSKKQVASELEPVMSGGLSGKPSVQFRSRTTSVSSSKESAQASKSSTGAIVGKARSHNSSSAFGSAGGPRAAGGSAKRVSPDERVQTNSPKSSNSSTTTSFHHFADDDGLQKTSGHTERKFSGRPASLTHAHLNSLKDSSTSASRTTSTRNTLSSLHRRDPVHAQFQPTVESEVSFEDHSLRSSFPSSAGSTPPSSLASRHSRTSARDTTEYEHKRDRISPTGATLHSVSLRTPLRLRGDFSNVPSSRSSLHGTSLLSSSKTWPIPQSPIPFTSDSPSPFSTSRVPIAYKDWKAMQERGIAAERQRISSHTDGASIGSRTHISPRSQTRSPYGLDEMDVKYSVPRSWASERSMTSYDTFPSCIRTISSISQAAARNQYVEGWKSMRLTVGEQAYW